MAWYLGYRFKWKYVRRIAEEQGLLDENPLATSNKVQNYIWSQAKVNVQFLSTSRDVIMCVRKSAVREDISRIKPHIMARIKALGKLLYGREHEPRWFPAKSYRRRPDDSSDDEQMPCERILPPGYFEGKVVIPIPPGLEELLDALSEGKITQDEFCQSLADD